MKGPAALLRNLVTYTLAFVALALLASAEPRALVLPLGSGLVGSLFSAALFAPSGAGPRRVALFAALTGLILAELGWTVSYWASPGLVAAACLWLCFYLAAGLIQGYLEGVFSRRLAVEYAVVGLVGFAIVLSAQPWRA